MTNKSSNVLACSRRYTSKILSTSMLFFIIDNRVEITETNTSIVDFKYFRSDARSLLCMKVNVIINSESYERNILQSWDVTDLSDLSEKQNTINGQIPEIYYFVTPEPDPCKHIIC